MCENTSCSNTVGGEIRILSNMIHRFVENLPNKKKVDSLTGTNAWIIGYIAESEKDVFQRDFEEKFGITRSTASKVVNLMVKKGLIERCGVPGDARLKKLVLTEKSRQIYELMTEDFVFVEHTLTEGFSEKELEQFFDFIHRMQRNLKDRREKNYD
ncbi:MAG: MarR family winged helix-turn-helix transcriptional regulator [Eubacterium sp.]